MTQHGAAATTPPDLSKLEEEAAKVLSPEALAYILAGAGDRETTRANAAAFRRWRVTRSKVRKRRKGRMALGRGAPVTPRERCVRYRVFRHDRVAIAHHNGRRS